MRVILGAAFLFSSFSAFAGFVHPMDFDGSEAQKQEVIDFIVSTVKADYCDSQIDMCQDATLRMMEKQNLSAFKQLTQAQNRKILDQVITDYCESELDMCSYSTISMMYNQNVKASKEKLEW